MSFRDRLLATIRAARPVLEIRGVLIVGSEVPNLLEPGAASTLVVSQDLDIGVPVERHAQVKQRLDDLRDFEPSADEPSVWTPRAAGLLELNFVGMDAAQDPAEAYVLEDDRLPLLVFGALSLVSPGAEIDVEGTRVTLPCPAGLILEKLITDRTGEKGDRDLLQRRLRQHRSRVLVRTWEYRQRHHAHGVWFRLRRLLADARDAYAISREDAEGLLGEGRRAEPAGGELEPPKLIVFVPPDRLARIASARPLPVRLAAELLAAECQALAPFDRTARE